MATKPPSPHRRGPHAAGLLCCIVQQRFDSYFFTMLTVFRMRETIW
jgi:hypothetical protein